MQAHPTSARAPCLHRQQHHPCCKAPDMKLKRNRGRLPLTVEESIVDRSGKPESNHNHTIEPEDQPEPAIPCMAFRETSVQYFIQIAPGPAVNNGSAACGLQRMPPPISPQAGFRSRTGADILQIKLRGHFQWFLESQANPALVLWESATVSDRLQASAYIRPY